MSVHAISKLVGFRVTSVLNAVGEIVTQFVIKLLISDSGDWIAGFISRFCDT